MMFKLMYLVLVYRFMYECEMMFDSMFFVNLASI